MLIKRIKSLWWRCMTCFIYSTMMYKIGRNSLIIAPLQIDYAKSINIGSNVRIYHNAWLMGSSGKDISLDIDDGTTLGHYIHLIARHGIKIEKNVLVADKVFITDCTHSYENPDMPVIEQSIKMIDKVVIGEGSWIGENVCIIGCSIGKHCVIGANSIVIHDIPEYSVAVGQPARVVKRYNHDMRVWEKVCE